MIPDFNFSAFYYNQIKDSLTSYYQRELPQINDKSDTSVFQQLISGFALVGHLSNALIDLVAQEFNIATSVNKDFLRDSLYYTHAYKVKESAPATVDIVARHNSDFSSNTIIIPPLASVSSDSAQRIDYTNLGPEISVSNNTSFSDIFFGTDDVVDFGLSSSSTVTGFGGGKSIYFGAQCMFNRIAFDIDSGSSSDPGYSVWEFYDPDGVSGSPDSVTITGNNLKFIVDGVLGSENVSGAIVKVTHIDSGVSSEKAVVFDGTNNTVTTGLLGQSVASSDLDSYSVSANWVNLNPKDSTSNLTISGNIDFELPQTAKKDWDIGTFNANRLFWVRFRTIFPELGGIVAYNSIVISGDRYSKAKFTQGEISQDSTFASGNGLPNQSYDLPNDFAVITDDFAISVDGEEWTRVDNFVGSGAQSKVYIARISGENERISVRFGDGVNGKVPPVGANNISATYVFGVQNDGNVGENLIRIDSTGLSNADQVYNPRQATGYSPSELSTEAGLALAKDKAVNLSLRKEVLLNADDVPEVIDNYSDSDGSNPVARSFGIENGLGVQTLQVLVVGSDGSQLTAQEISDLETYLNGDGDAVRKRVGNGIQAFVQNYDPVQVSVNVDVESKRDIEESVRNAIFNAISPDYMENGRFFWSFGIDGNEVAISKLTTLIHNLDPSITNVKFNEPTSDVLLTRKQLPAAGSVVVNIKENL